MTTLTHHGVKGMKWGVRKVVDQTSGRKAIDYQTEGFVIKKGSSLHRISTVSNEINKGSGYASFLEEDAKAYKQIGKVFSKVGMKQFDMTMKAKKKYNAEAEDIASDWGRRPPPLDV